MCNRQTLKEMPVARQTEADELASTALLILFSTFLIFLRAAVNEVFLKAQILRIPTRMAVCLSTLRTRMT